MDPLGQRKMFLEGTNIFSNQKVNSTRNRVIEFLNEIAMAENHQTKCENITKVQELILHTEKDLCEEFLYDILALSQDKNADVRKCVAGFIEETCKVDASLFPNVLDVLTMLLRDNSPQVIKKVIQAASLIYKNTVRYLSSSSLNITDEMEQSWNKLCLVKTQVLDMLDNENDGIRTNAIKFLESVIIYQTSREGGPKIDNDFSLDDIPVTIKIFKRRKAIEDEALNIFDQLIKFHAAPHISSVNLIACTGSLCTVAKLRPPLMTPVVEALKNVHNNLPPTLTNSQVSSVRKHFKIQFLGLLKHAGSIDVQPQLISMLEDLGCGDEIKKNLPKPSNLPKKRTSEAAIVGQSHKRAKRDPEVFNAEENTEEESNLLNQKFLQEKLSNVENAVALVAEYIKCLPSVTPASFLVEYTPFKEMTVEEQVKQISTCLAAQMTEAAVGPGAEHRTSTLSSTNNNKNTTEVEGDNAAKRLRETLERVKSLDKSAKSKVKPKATKTLQEITKPFTKNTKLLFLNQAIGRIIKSDSYAQRNNVALKHTKILTVLGSTFLPSVRALVLEYILTDFGTHINLALSWLFEEYSLIQGFVRHSYIKHGPDNAYNELLLSFLRASLHNSDPKEKKFLIQKLYINIPLVTDDAIKFLEEMCAAEDMSDTAINICKDILIRKPPKAKILLQLLLKMSISECNSIREEAIVKIISIYNDEPHLQSEIDTYTLTLINYLRLNEPPEIFHGQDGIVIWNEDLAKICLRLAMELLPHRDKLLHDIAEVYVKTTSDIKRTILRAIENPVKQLGQNNTELLNLIENCIAGSETLITRIIYILTEKVAPSQELVDRVKELHATKVSDVRLLIPIVCGLSKKELLNSLPKFVKLNPAVVKEVFNRLLTAAPDVAPLKPNELLVALHTLDPNQVEIKYTVKATSLCLVERDIYTHEVLAAVLQQLVDINPLPTLLMRTVLQALSLYPKLSGFVINLLQRLILKQVWKQKVVWDGFLKSCHRLMPASFGVLIQLPPPQLENALKTCVELKEPLTEYARTIADNQIGIVPHQIIKILLDNEGESSITASKEISTKKQKSPTREFSPTDDAIIFDKNAIEPAPPGME